MNDMKDSQFQTLLALITEFKEDSSKQRQEDKSDSNRRFEQIDRRFEDITHYMKDFKSDVNRRFDEINSEIQELKIDVKQDKNKLQEVYNSRDKVTVSFTRSWAMFSFFMAFSASTMATIISVIIIKI
jgi:hypothetical protein